MWCPSCGYDLLRPLFQAMAADDAESARGEADRLRKLLGGLRLVRQLKRMALEEGEPE
jgi:hypothetical protein